MDGSAGWFRCLAASWFPRLVRRGEVVAAVLDGRMSEPFTGSDKWFTAHRLSQADDVTRNQGALCILTRDATVRNCGFAGGCFGA